MKAQICTENRVLITRHRHIYNNDNQHLTTADRHTTPTQPGHNGQPTTAYRQPGTDNGQPGTDTCPSNGYAGVRKEMGTK
ncbi:MAG: hypothetical protein IPK46_14715 [Saprospiraceae bacterium]|nr:hypothetical protein [Saprospiraceae bacterium]